MNDSEDFVQRDVVTGKKIRNPLNKGKLSPYELDEIFLEG